MANFYELYPSFASIMTKHASCSDDNIMLVSVIVVSSKCVSWSIGSNTYATHMPNACDLVGLCLSKRTSYLIVEKSQLLL